MVTALHIENVSGAEGRELAELRARAMRPSLAAIGRFDERRVRERFLSGFVPADTRKIVSDGKLLGFYVARFKADHIYLDHLYIEPGFQGSGPGARIIALLKESAKETGLPIRLGGLRESRANDFYHRQGFEVTHEDEYDIYHEWQPDREGAAAS